MTAIPMVDVFAGPGGLNEGFSSLRDKSGGSVFEAVASFEMDPFACQTLRLRAALRQADREMGELPNSYYRFLRGELTYDGFVSDDVVKPLIKSADEEVCELRLGEQTRDESDDIIRRRLAATLAADEPWVLVGGPPCQAYSLAGRSRRTNDETFKDDHKHVLYREYLHIIRKFRPAIFVMENVKGMLSSRHEGGGIFDAIKSDLENPTPGLRYEIRSFNVAAEQVSPKDYILRSEDYGIPQRRHRVILLGVRTDLGLPRHSVLEQRTPVTVRETIQGMPAIRSMVSPRAADSNQAWLAVAEFVHDLVGRNGKHQTRTPALGARFVESESVPAGSLTDWLVDERIGGVSLHESRAHMFLDLARYGFLAHESGNGRAPKLGELPLVLRPKHKNAGRENAPFADRFRVQHWDGASTTVVSHISKDGHYYIHPDPRQMRSLTVREAARLQTFPDNYLFMGNRTQQYHQVGNAVPPLLARQLGEVVAQMLGR